MRKQIAVEDNVWQELNEIRREISHTEHKDFTVSETLYELIIVFRRAQSEATAQLISELADQPAPEGARGPAGSRAPRVERPSSKQKQKRSG